MRGFLFNPSLHCHILNSVLASQFDHGSVCFMNSDSEVEEIVNRSCAQLAEHFDSVQIFVTKHKGGESVTQNMEVGRGNFYARLGHVRDWLRIQDQFTRQHAIRKDSE